MQFPDRPKQGGNLFIRLANDGESVKGVFQGNPFTYFNHFVSGKSQVCSGTGCALCKQGERANFRFKMNMVVNEDGAYTAKIFEGNGTTYDTLKTMIQQGYKLDEIVVLITRSGKGTKTKYSVLPAPGPALTAEQITRIKSVPLKSLEPRVESEPLEYDPNFDVK